MNGTKNTSRYFWTFLSIGAISAAALCRIAWGAPETPDAASPPVFERHILPILQSACFDCHGGKKNKLGLDARQRRLLVRGGDSGPAIVPGKAGESLLFRKVSAREMPPGNRPKLAADQLELIRRWIDAGAPAEAEEKPIPDDGGFATVEDRQFWAFQPVRRPPVPAARGGRNPIDAFILEKQQEQSLLQGFTPEASRRTLIRRVHLDLLGLPPEPQEVEEFLADAREDAYERLVDRLLASPRYGERWGRHWLDAAGYADSEGYTDSDHPRPEAWKYRDFVIRSFNADKPYDEFLAEQLAGDELAGYPGCDLDSRNQELLAATGYLRMAADGTSDAGQLPARNQVISDTLKIFTSGVMGLTIGCAQCHDHRYDPISQKDYYRLRAAFEPAYDLARWKAPPARRISLFTDADRQRTAEADKAIAVKQGERRSLEQDLIRKAIERILGQELAETDRAAARQVIDTAEDKRTEEQKKLLARFPQLHVTGGTLYQYDPQGAEKLKGMDQEIGRLAAARPREDFIRALSETPGEAGPCRLLIRGNPEEPGEEVEPGVPEVLVSSAAAARLPPENQGKKTSGRRLALARWLVRPENPLTARVLANRIWLHHFGRGLVGTPGDFGTQGERPTHAELLDWLADELMRGGWTIKGLHRLILASEAYRQDSAGAGEAAAALYARKPIFRLEGEIIRDCMLAASGMMSARMFGSPVPVREDAEGRIEVGVDQKSDSNMPGVEVPLGEEAARRTVYVEVRRSRPLSLTRAFDMPDMETNCTSRPVSIIAPQALTLLNGGFVRGQADALARLLEKQAAGAGARVDLAFRRTLARPPDAGESAAALEFLQAQTGAASARGAAAADAEHAALRNFCHVLFNTSEFITRD